MSDRKNLAEILVPGDEQKPGQKIDFPAHAAPAPKDRRKKYGYDGTGVILHVGVSPWPSKYDFYTRFSSRVEELWSMTHDPVPYEPYFSYMPRYEQMSTAQKAYYLYWRSQVRHGNYPPADSSYILLYLYELINMSDILPPEEVTRFVARIWKFYRKDYPYLDKYAGEWLCDLLLIYHLSSPGEDLSDIIGEVLPNLTIPEVILSGTDSNLEAAVFSVIKGMLKKSTYYSGENKALFDEHIPGAVRSCLEECGPELLLTDIHPMRIVRDSFSGAIVKCGVKYELEVQYRPFLKSKLFLSRIQSLVKMSENELRAVLGVKSRYKPVPVNDRCREIIYSYFDRSFPNRNKVQKKEDESYLQLYEPDNKDKADAARAAEIENEAWKTALELGETEEEPAEMPRLPEMTPSPEEKEGDGFSDFFRQLDEKNILLIRAALNGIFTETCRKMKVIPAEAERMINECSMDTVGDAVLENGAPVEDYREDLASRISKGE